MRVLCGFFFCAVTCWFEKHKAAARGQPSPAHLKGVAHVKAWSGQPPFQMQGTCFVGGSMLKQHNSLRGRLNCRASHAQYCAQDNTNSQLEPNWRFVSLLPCVCVCVGGVAFCFLCVCVCLFFRLKRTPDRQAALHGRAEALV